MLLLGLLASCGRSPENGSSANRSDSLERVVAQKDSVINDVFAVDECRSGEPERDQAAREHYQRQSRQREIPKQSAVKINEDIAAIDRLLQENRRTIDRLQQSADQLKKANVRVASLEKLIAQLQSQVESKDQEIVMLRKNLENMNVQVAQLSEQVTGLHTQVSDLSVGESLARGRSQNAERHTQYGLLHGRTREGIASERDRL